MLKVPESWLRKKAAARVIPCTFVGKHLRLSADDIEKIIKAGTRAPVSTVRRPRRATTTTTSSGPTCCPGSATGR